LFQDISVHSGILPILTLAVGLPLILIGLTILLSTGLVLLFKMIFNTKDLTKFGKKMNKKLNERTKARKDTYRKIPHVLIFIGLFVLWFIGVMVVKSFTGKIEGMIPSENNMIYVYLQILTIPNSIKSVLLSLGWFYYLLFFFFYCLCLSMLANEYTRKTKNFSFPFNIFSTVFLSEEERKGYGTYLHFGIGHMFAALFCPPMVFFSILGMSSIADLMTSQIGIRYGKARIHWNNDKTWEGTIAGVFICFIICFFFIGVIWASIFTLCFLLFDIFTNKPINISDNLLIPIGTAIVFVVIRFLFNLNYSSLILVWI